jgi:hypothetical protein
LINRRHYLPRLLLTLSSFEKNDQRILTGHYISHPKQRRMTASRFQSLAAQYVKHEKAGSLEPLKRRDAVCFPERGFHRGFFSLQS